VTRNLPEVAVVPCGLDASEDGGGFGIGVVPADPESVAVCGIDAHAGVAALINE
jgi:hypothetical protein